MVWKLSNQDPEELTDESTIDNVAQDIFMRGTCSDTCKRFMQSIGFEYLTASNRIVFTDGDYVIKFATDEENTTINIAELNATQRLRDADVELIAPVVETQQRGDRWIKMKKADRETTDEHYESVKEKLDSIGETADLVDENIGILDGNPVLVDYPELAEYDL